MHVCRRSAQGGGLADDLGTRRRVRVLQYRSRNAYSNEDRPPLRTAGRATMPVSHLILRLLLILGLAIGPPGGFVHALSHLDVAAVQAAQSV